MAEPILNPIPNPEALPPKQLIIGETPVYFTSPQEIDGKTVESFLVLDSDTRASALTGIGTATILMKEPSRKQGERGILIDKPLLFANKMDPVEWDKVSGVRYTDANNVLHDIPKEQLNLEPPSKEVSNFAKASLDESRGVENPLPDEAPIQEEPIVDILEASKKQKEAPILARTVLETLTEDPNTITIVGLKAYEVRARDLAARKMQTLFTPAQKDMTEAQNRVWEKTKDTADWFKNLGHTIWKQSIGGTYFAERARQYYMDMLKASETPFAEDAIKMAENRAKITYDKLLSDKNFIARAGTKAVEWTKDVLGMRTLIQRFALQEIGNMKVAGEIKGIESFDREAKAVRLRFSQDMDKADIFIRRNLGEKLDILNPSDETHKPLVDGIKGLMRDYATGEIADKQTFDERSKEFFKTTLKDARPNVFAEAELYSSSLFDAAETLRAKREHVGGIEAINADLHAMTIRLGLAQMGEVTSLIPSKVESATKKITDIAEWIESKGIPFRPALFNEVTIGTGVALSLSALNFVKTMPLAPFGLGAVAGGTFAGFREYGALQRDYLTHLREREAGDTFGESMKRRNFFEKYLVSQRSAEEMMGKIQTSLYEADGTIKTTLTDDQLRMGMATITDITARKAVSETGDKKRIGLIRFSERESIETQRTALDVTSHKALTDIETYLSTHTQQAANVLGGTTLEEFMVKLTTNQTTVLKNGAQALSNISEDPVRNVLGLVASYAPEINILKRRFPLAARGLPPEQQILGMDAILDQFTRDARVEAVKYGIKAGIIGAGVGAVMHGVGDFIWHKAPDIAGTAAENIKERISNIDHPASFTPDALTPEHVTNPFMLSEPLPDHTVTIGENTYQLPKELIIDRIKSGFGDNTTYNAKLDFSDGYTVQHDQPDIIFGENLSASQLKEVLDKAGIQIIDAHNAGDALSGHPVDLHSLNPSIPEGMNTTIPDGYSLEYHNDTGHEVGWNLIRESDNETIVRNIHISNDGAISNLPEVQGELAGQGITLTNPILPIIPNGEVSPIETPVATGEMTLTGNELENGSLWDHFLNQVQKTPDENPMASTNGMKNLFRLYEQYNVEHDANGLPENIHSSDIRLRDATFAGEPVRELDISHIPGDAQITELPEKVFGAEGVASFQELQQRALIDYQKELLTSKGPMDAINTMYNNGNPDLKLEAIALKLGYIGDDAHLPTEGDVNLLIEHMNSTSVDTGGVTDTAGGSSNIHEIVINKVYEDTIPTSYIGSSDSLEIPYMTITEGDSLGSQAEKIANTLPWFPIFIPYRASLEREYIPAAEPSTTPLTNSEFLSPFGNEQMYVTKDVMDARKSQRLTENPEAQLKTFEEFNWYLSTLTDAERQTVLELHAQNDKPMAAEVTRVVAIPTMPAQAAQVYQTLSQFTTQTDPTGTLLDPKHTEIVLLSHPSDAMKTEIDRFKADHPNLSVVYVTKEYEGPVGFGQQKRDLTNLIFHRMETRGEIDSDVAIINASIENSALSPTYLSTISTTLENPMTDMVSGSFHLPKEAYSTYPMLFASMRLQEMFDGMVRHGETSSMPNVISGNTAVKASTLAAVGGYNEKAAIAEDRELVHFIKTARNNRPDAIVENVDLDQTINPKESLYRVLQNLGVADKAILLEQHELYKDKTWQELATKATENFTREHLELSINQLYQQSYPTLKGQNPELFDAYFGRSMDALGLSYEITDGVVHITDDSLLAQNMAAELDIEAFSKQSAKEINPAEVISARQTLEAVAGTTDEQIAENTIEKTSLEPSVSSPDVDESVPSWLSELKKQEESAISSPEVVDETPDVEQEPAEILQSTLEAPKIVIKNETLPKGVTDRINYLIEKHAKEGQATVEVTPNELMDYVKSTVSIPNGRITEGSLAIQNDKVRITDIVVQTPIGKAKISGDLIDDPTYGLHLDPNTLDTQLDLLLRTQGAKIKENANTLTDKIKTHFNEKITDPNWESSTMHVNGDKISLTFVKKTTTPTS